MNLLNKSGDSKFLNRNWNIVNDQLNANYDIGYEIIYSTEVLKSDHCDYNDAYILGKENITIIWHNVTQVEFKNCASFIKCITIIDGTTIDNAENLDLVMLLYNLFQCSLNYSDTTGSLWFDSIDEASNFDADTANDNAFKSFTFKAK